MKKFVLFIAFTIVSCLPAISAEPHEVTSPVPSVHALAADDTTSLIGRVESWYAENMNYGTIATLMAVESSFIPFPSEVVVPPAAYVAGIEGNSLHTTDNYPLNVLLVEVILGLFDLFGR